MGRIWKILEDDDECDKKKKSQALKDKEEKDYDSDKYMTLLVRNSKRFIEHEKQHDD